MIEDGVSRLVDSGHLVEGFELEIMRQLRHFLIEPEKEKLYFVRNIYNFEKSDKKIYNKAKGFL